MAQNNRELAKKSLDLKWAPNRFVDKQDKELNAIQSQMDLLLEGAGDVESAFLKKAPHERDAYDLAFAKLNPESARKADKYWKLAQKKLKVENEKVNLEAARDLMNQVYSEQLNNINSGYDALNEASGIRNNITLNAAQSATGGLGSNAVANAALRAQASNQIAKEGLDIEAQRQRDLAQAAAAQMQTPAILSQIGAANANIDLAREATKSQATSRSGGWRVRRRWQLAPSRGGEAIATQPTNKLTLAPEEEDRLREMAEKKGSELVKSTDGDYFIIENGKPSDPLTQMDVDDIFNQKEIPSRKSGEAQSSDTLWKGIISPRESVFWKIRYDQADKARQYMADVVSKNNKQKSTVKGWKPNSDALYLGWSMANKPSRIKMFN